MVTNIWNSGDDLYYREGQSISMGEVTLPVGGYVYIQVKPPKFESKLFGNKIFGEKVELENILGYV